MWGEEGESDAAEEEKVFEEPTEEDGEDDGSAGMRDLWKGRTSTNVDSKLVFLADVLPPAPGKGTFDLNKVRDSSYFLCVSSLSFLSAFDVGTDDLLPAATNLFTPLSQKAVDLSTPPSPSLLASQLSPSPFRLFVFPLSCYTMRFHTPLPPSSCVVFSAYRPHRSTPSPLPSLVVGPIFRSFECNDATSSFPLRVTFLRECRLR